jgi:glycosyltransferase involved in cell wall biosynthesis
MNDTRRIRVAHVTLGLDVGGQEKLLVEFARLADRRVFELFFVSLSTRGRLTADVEGHGWPVHALGEPDGLRPGISLRLAQLFRRWRIDVVHTHDDRPLIYGASGARLARVPGVVHSRHGQSFGITRRQAALVQLAAGMTDHFVCVSKDSARRAVEHGLPAGKVRTIWNGIDLTRFELCPDAPRGRVVTVARLSPEKDVATLLRAAALAVREEPDWRLQIAGDGVCLGDLRRLAQELGLGDRVEFLGPVRDVPALLAESSLFVLSSLSEGVSLTLLEAMARGRAVVATDVGGNPEVVVPGETGLLVPPRQPEQLARALLALWRDPEKSRAMGLAGRRRVERHFDIRQMVAAYEALYRPFCRPTRAAATRPGRVSAPLGS